MLLVWSRDWEIGNGNETKEITDQNEYEESA